MTKRIILLQALAATPHRLARLLKTVDDRRAAQRADTGARSMIDVIDHLIEMEQTSLLSIRQFAGKRAGSPRAPAQPTNSPDHESLLHDRLSVFTEARTETLTSLSNVAPQDWLRREPRSVPNAPRLLEIVQQLVWHDRLHLTELADMTKHRRDRADGRHQNSNG